MPDDPMTEPDTAVRSRAMRSVSALIDRLPPSLPADARACLSRVMMRVYPEFCAALQAERLLNSNPRDNMAVAATVLLITNQIWEVVHVALPENNPMVSASLMLQNISGCLNSGPTDGRVEAPSLN